MKRHLMTSVMISACVVLAAFCRADGASAGGGVHETEAQKEVGIAAGVHVADGERLSAAAARIGSASGCPFLAPVADMLVRTYGGDCLGKSFLVDLSTGKRVLTLGNSRLEDGQIVKVLLPARSLSCFKWLHIDDATLEAICQVFTGVDLVVSVTPEGAVEATVEVGCIPDFVASDMSDELPDDPFCGLGADGSIAALASCGCGDYAAQLSALKDVLSGYGISTDYLTLADGGDCVHVKLDVGALARYVNGDFGSDMIKAVSFSGEICDAICRASGRSAASDTRGRAIGLALEGVAPSASVHDRFDRLMPRTAGETLLCAGVVPVVELVRGVLCGLDGVSELKDKKFGDIARFFCQDPDAATAFAVSVAQHNDRFGAVLRISSREIGGLVNAAAAMAAANDAGLVPLLERAPVQKRTEASETAEAGARSDGSAMSEDGYSTMSVYKSGGAEGSGGGRTTRLEAATIGLVGKNGEVKVMIDVRSSEEDMNLDAEYLAGVETVFKVGGKGHAYALEKRLYRDAVKNALAGGTADGKSAESVAEAVEKARRKVQMVKDKGGEPDAVDVELVQLIVRERMRRQPAAD